MAHPYFWPKYDAYRQQRTETLSGLVIPGESCTPRDGEPLADYSTTSGSVHVIFRDLEERLIECIEDADEVYGCVAWLTSEPILEALAGKQVQIVVQKEDFLRPDVGQSSAWKARLHRLYDRLIQGYSRYSFPDPVGGMDYCGDPTVEAIRCVGNHNASRNPAFPRAHHKFVVFCRDGFTPYAVWTGSFNFTRNAGRSFENAVVINDPVIAQAYLKEWAQLLAISEPLDWQSEWVAPQWRIGS